MFLYSKLTAPHSFTSNPKFFAYHSFVSFGLSEKKKMPPMPVTFDVVSFDESVFSFLFFDSSMLFVFLCVVIIFWLVQIWLLPGFFHSYFRLFFFCDAYFHTKV